MGERESTKNLSFFRNIILSTTAIAYTIGYTTAVLQCRLFHGC